MLFDLSKLPQKIEKQRMSMEEYLRLTKPILRLYFKTLKDYDKLLQQAPPLRWASCGIINGLERATIANSEEEIKRSNRIYKTHSKYHYSEQIICGSIFQLAYTAIDLFSKNTTIHPGFSTSIKPKAKSKIFCIGREIKNVPLGLIIYATRHQYVHWLDDNVNPLVKAVFKKINNEYGNNFSMDLAFSLTNP